MLKVLEKITFEITNQCNLQCKICNIWKEKTKINLSLENIKKILEGFKKPLTISLTGGEPFLNPKIDRIYRYLFKLFLQKKIKNIDIATNAYSKKILDFLENNRNYLFPLSLSISMDGLEKNHNRQRGKNDAFQNTLKNIIVIKKYNIPVTLKFVISKINYKDLIEVYRLSRRIGTSFNVKFIEEVPNYYHRQDEYSDLALNDQELSVIKKDIEEIYKNENKKKNLTSFSLLCIKNFLNNENLNFIKKCLTPEYSLFITCYGKVYNCLYQESIGDIKNWPNLNWDKAKEISNNAKKGLCPRCLSYHGYLRGINYRK